MKSNGYSPSTTLAQGELLAFHMTQKSVKIHDQNSNVKQAVGKHGRFSSDKYLCIRILPFDIMDETQDISTQKQKFNEIDFYHSCNKIARWLIKKSEYNKPASGVVSMHHYDGAIRPPDHSIRHFDVSIRHFDFFASFRRSFRRFDVSIRHFDVSIRHFDVSIRHFDVSIRHFDVSIRHSDVSIRRFDVTIRHSEFFY